MSKDVIDVDGEEVVVREDTAKAYRWKRFAVIIFTGIILIFLGWIVFFSGFLLTTQPGTGTGPASNAVQNGPVGP
ncbi:MAG TPA: hypothetical protein VJ781_11970 [Pyrinomonadaceae bacterium]|jgi:hypothetical protein|nr:hypothetical protein [Pyrinomonadaceae bacterium]